MKRRSGTLRKLYVLTLLLSARFALAIPKEKPSEVDPALLQIAVEVVEVDETKTQKLGMEWINSLHVNEIPGSGAIFKLGVLDRSILFADIQALLQEGAADLLANPKLVTRDGTEANFHAGGELPYVTAATLGTTTVLFKEYGVKLKIKPKIITGPKMNISIEAEVSAPDVQRAVSLSGNVVPGLLSRRVQSELTMNSGTTLALAGMIQNEKQWNRSGVPGLSKIPLLGYLFSRKIEETRRTSIVIFITPTILEGAPPAPSIVSALPIRRPQNPPVALPPVTRDSGPSLEELVGAHNIPGGELDAATAF